MPINAIPYTNVYEIVVDDVSELTGHPEIKDRVRIHVNGNPGKDYIFREDIPFTDAPPGSINVAGLTGSLIEDSGNTSFGYINGSTDLTPAGMYYVDVNDVTEVVIPPATGNLSRRHFIITSNKDTVPQKAVIGSLSKPKEEVIYTSVVSGASLTYRFKLKSDGLIGRITLDLRADDYSIPNMGRVLITAGDDVNDLLYESIISVKSESLVNIDIPCGLEVAANDKITIIIEAFSSTGFEVATYKSTHYGIEGVSSIDGLRAEVYYLEKDEKGQPPLGNISNPTPTTIALSSTTYKYQEFKAPVADTIETLALRLGVTAPTVSCVVRVIIVDELGSLLFSSNVMVNSEDSICVIKGVGLDVLEGKSYTIGLRIISNSATAVTYLSDAISNDIIGAFDGTTDKAQLLIGFEPPILTGDLITNPDNLVVTFKSLTPFNNEDVSTFSVYAGQEVIVTDVKSDLYHLVIGGNTINEVEANRFSVTLDMINELASI